MYAKAKLGILKAKFGLIGNLRPQLWTVTDLRPINTLWYKVTQSNFHNQPGGLEEVFKCIKEPRLYLSNTIVPYFLK